MIKDDLLKIAKRDFEWFIVIAGSAILFFGALFYEYVLGMAPCHLCIQQRALIFGILLSTTAAYIFHFKKYNNPSVIKTLIVISFVCLTVFFSAYAYDIASTHLANSAVGEFSFLFSTCDGGEPFPSYLPLDQWSPFLFGVKASCSDGIAKALGVEMPVYVQFFSVLVTVISCAKMLLALRGNN